MEIFKEEYPVMFILGKRRQGKTFLALWLMLRSNLMNNVRNILIVCPTVRKQKDYATFTRIIDSRHNVNLIISERIDIDYSSVPINTLLLVDDSGVIRNKDFLACIQRNRHNRQKIIFLGQFSNHIMPEIRENIDYLFSFRQHSKMEIQNIWESFVISYMTKKNFERLFASLAERYFLIVSFDNDVHMAVGCISQ